MKYVILETGASGLVRKAYGPMSIEEAEEIEVAFGLIAVPLDEGRPGGGEEE